MTTLAAGPVKWPGDADLMDGWVQEALDDPRVGDVFHEMYSYGVEVIALVDDPLPLVVWRSFATETLDTGTKTRAEWSESFRYGDHMPGKHTMHLMRRGVDGSGRR